MADAGAIEALHRLERGAARVEVLSFFDALPPVPCESLIGQWHGAEIATGHAFDGLLGPAGWYGKSFRSADDVDPLLFRRKDGRLFAGNPALMPLKLLERMPGLAKHPLSAPVFRAVAPLLATRRPRARLRMVEYRGKSSAAMIYDDLPIVDVFRQVDGETVIGAMDIRGYKDPFLFALRRD